MLLEAIALTIAAVGWIGFLIVLARGIPWLIAEFRNRDLYPSTHIADPDDRDIDFDAALRSIGGRR